jgi:hypothetical protein
MNFIESFSHCSSSTRLDQVDICSIVSGKYSDIQLPWIISRLVREDRFCYWFMIEFFLPSTLVKRCHKFKEIKNDRDLMLLNFFIDFNLTHVFGYNYQFLFSVKYNTENIFYHLIVYIFL